MTATDASSPPGPAPEARSALLTLSVPVGSRVLVVSDLHLGRDPSSGHVSAIAELTQAISSWSGPGVLVLAGNTFATAPAKPGVPGSSGSCQRVVAAHGRLIGSIAAFAAGPGRKVVVLPGDRDIQLAWSETERRAVAGALGAEIALAVDLEVETGAGRRRIRVEPGQRLDPLTAHHDPTNPGESPLSQHLRAEVFPAVREQETARSSRDAWLTGLEDLEDPATFPRFIASRLAYRKLGRRAWLLLVPVLLAIAFRLPVGRLRHVGSGGLSTRLTLFGTITLVEVVILAAIAIGSLRRTYGALASLAAGEADREPNRAARDLARSLIADGYHGLITGHTCRPELTDLGVGFFANAGCTAEVVSETPARLPGLGLPPVFLARRQLSWIELEAGSELHVRLLHALQQPPGVTVLERLAVRRTAEHAPAKDLRPQIVASFPLGASWPAQPSGQLRKRRIRRLSGLFVAAAGFISLLSALSDPLRDRLHAIRTVVPIVVPETAAALAAFAGVALLVLARGVRRGQRRAWAVTVAILLAAAVLDVVKGVDVEEALVAVAVAAFLWINRAEFQGATERPELRGALRVWVFAAAATVVAGTAGIQVGALIGGVADRVSPDRVGPSHAVIGRERFSISWWHALQATTGRMIGDRSAVPLPHALDRFFAPAVLVAALGLVVSLVVILFRPVADRRRQAVGVSPDHGLDRARAVFARHGSGTLDYFALRPDKQFWFWGDTVVAYAVYGGVCLVSPDPIGPVAEREPAWRAFRRFVDGHGWALGGLGAGEEWLPVYRSTGMHDLYVGDEGVVRTGRFTLEGGRYKGLRQAVNRVAKYGYTISFHDPSTLDSELRVALGEVMTKSRRGDVERGFSMTLGRVFEPDDSGLLLAVVHGPAPAGEPDGTSGPPVAFCQYVPAPGIGGYSLDLMRRDDGEHPNGLIDFAVVETIKYLRDHGNDGLGLNFATMRAVLARETGEGPVPRIQGWLLRRMGGSMQIESLWRFNAKFDPDWQPRYATYDAPEHALAVAVAIARAESFWELPVIGRFLVPSGDPTIGAACDALAVPVGRAGGSVTEAPAPSTAGAERH